MATTARPGGLTILATLNFLFAGCWVIGVFLVGSVIHYKHHPEAIPAGLEPQVVSFLKAAGSLPDWLLYGRIALAPLKMALLTASGVGYLMRHRFLGRFLGNTYAALSIAESVVGVAAGFTLVAELLGVMYAGLTLLVLNHRLFFRDQLVR
jgi:hypothetical protein